MSILVEVRGRSWLRAPWSTIRFTDLTVQQVVPSTEHTAPRSSRNTLTESSSQTLGGYVTEFTQQDFSTFAKAIGSHMGHLLDNIDVAHARLDAISERCREAEGERNLGVVKEIVEDWRFSPRIHMSG